MAVLLHITLLALFCSLASARFALTPLMVDNHPCQPENLKRSTRYICDAEGEVHCLNGWQKAKDEDVAHPCSIPVCDPACENGECRAPNTCACEIGWEGECCSDCITLPGCKHGSCKDSGLSCVCDNSTLWGGGLCDIPVCSNPCAHGSCVAPGLCLCQSGWTGEQCHACEKLPGCVHGSCMDPSTHESFPNSCFCEEGWTGPLCNQLDCGEPCDHGECRMVDELPACVCQVGWRGPQCDECVAYPGCPEPHHGPSCVNPWECNCDENVEDALCGIHLTGAAAAGKPDVTEEEVDEIPLVKSKKEPKEEAAAIK